MRRSRRMFAAAVAVTAIGWTAWLGGDGRAQERREWGGRLGSPAGDGRAVDETGARLGRPAPGASARRIRGHTDFRTPSWSRTANTPRTARPRELSPDPGARGTRRSPAYVELRVRGLVASEVRDALTADLAFVPEIRVDAGARFVVGGRATFAAGGLRAPGSHAARTGEPAVDVQLEVTDRRGGDGALARRYRGPRSGLRAFVHSFVDDLVEALTGARSHFGGRLVFSRRLAPGRKAIFTMAVDGSDLTQVSGDTGVATLPSFGPRAIWYSVATPTGVFITHTGRNERPVVGGPGVHMGVRVCAGELLFASTRDGNTDVWRAALDGSDERRLTRSASIDISPTCGPGGRIAFVSDRRGRPQIFLLGEEGLQQLTRGDRSAQTPAWCDDQTRPRLAFTQVGGGYRVMVVDVESGEVTAVSPDEGLHKDPAFSPDCRMLAWSSSDGIVVSTADGSHRRVIAEGHAETLRWSR